MSFIPDPVEDIPHEEEFFTDELPPPLDDSEEAEVVEAILEVDSEL